MTQQKTKDHGLLGNTASGTPNDPPSTPNNEAAIMAASRRYVMDSLDIMRRYGSAPDLTDQELDLLVERVAAYPLKLLRMKTHRVRARRRDADVPAAHSLDSFPWEYDPTTNTIKSR